MTGLFYSQEESFGTTVDAFIQRATSPESAEWDALECGDDVLTYVELLQVAKGIALEIQDTCNGEKKPTVAIVSENHPYVFAVIFATWMLGGIVAPLDAHAPEPLLQGMLRNAEPSCVVLQSSNEKNVRLVGGICTSYQRNHSPD